jgi:ABC-type antimicrobial peptide transport system permease subunit
LVTEVRRAIGAIEPAAFVDVRTLRDATGFEANLRNLGARLFGVVSAVALLLATMGLYGVMAFVVSSRTREIGTRMAIGAASADILRSILVQGLRMVAIGLAIGALASWVLARALVSLLAGLSPADPIAFGSAILILVFVGVAACYFPARRAAALNPVEALRVE